MKNLKNDEALIRKAISLYFKACERTMVNPQTPDPTACEFGSRYLYLNNRSGCIVRIEYTKHMLHIELNGVILEEEIIES